MRRLAIITVAAVLTAVAIGWFMVVKLPGWFGPRPIAAPTEPAMRTKSPCDCGTAQEP